VSLRAQGAAGSPAVGPAQLRQSASIVDAGRQGGPGGRSQTPRSTGDQSHRAPSQDPSSRQQARLRFHHPSRRIITNAHVRSTTSSIHLAGWAAISTAKVLSVIAQPTSRVKCATAAGAPLGDASKAAGEGDRDRNPRLDNTVTPGSSSRDPPTRTNAIARSARCPTIQTDAGLTGNSGVPITPRRPVIVVTPGGHSASPPRPPQFATRDPGSPIRQILSRPGRSSHPSRVRLQALSPPSGPKINATGASKGRVPVNQMASLRRSAGGPCERADLNPAHLIETVTATHVGNPTETASFSVTGQGRGKDLLSGAARDQSLSFNRRRQERAAISDRADHFQPRPKRLGMTAPAPVAQSAPGRHLGRRCGPDSATPHATTLRSPALRRRPQPRSKPSRRSRTARGPQSAGSPPRADRSTPG